MEQKGNNDCLWYNNSILQGTGLAAMLRFLVIFAGFKQIYPFLDVTIVAGEGWLAVLRRLKRMTPRTWLGLCLVMLLVAFSSIFSPVAEATTGEQFFKYPISQFEILEDANATYDFDTINSGGLGQQFQPYSEQVISLGITKSVYWVRFRLPYSATDSAPNQLLQLTNPNIDKIDVYIPVAGNGTSGPSYLLKTVGVSRSAANLEIRDNSWVFSIPRQFDYSEFVYLRLESSSALRLPVVLWADSQYLSEAFLRNLGFGTFYGILFAMFFYNLFICFVLRDKTYFYYIHYIACMFFYQFQVHGHLRLWLDMSYAVYNAVFWLNLTAAFIVSVYFAASFLQVHNGDAPWDQIMTVLVAVAMAQGALGVLGYNYWANQIAHGLGLAGPLLFMALAAWRFRQGFKPARYFLLAWGVLSVGIVVWVLAAYIPDTFSAVNYLLVATAAEAILLSFALSYRIKAMRLKEAVMEKHIEYYRDLSVTDELTGLYNKRHLKVKLTEKMKEACQNREPLTLMVIDIDYFKSFNDQYGHWEGDRVLVRISEIILSVLDSSQQAFRYGGEELVVILPAAGAKEASSIAERIRRTIYAAEFRPAPDVTTRVGVSIGLAEFDHDDTIESLFQRADTAMYEAKTTGRNKVCIYHKAAEAFPLQQGKKFQQ